MGFHGFSLISVNAQDLRGGFNESPGISMDFHWLLFISIDFHGLVLMDLHLASSIVTETQGHQGDRLVFSMDLHEKYLFTNFHGGCAQISVDFHGFAWTSMDPFP